jgi:hypothetical protein
LPSGDEAIKLLVDGCASEIASGSVDALDGARAMFDLWVNENEGTELMAQIRPFVDLAFDEDSPFQEPDAKHAAIIDEAKRLLGRGGLQLPL